MIDWQTIWRLIGVLALAACGLFFLIAKPASHKRSRQQTIIGVGYILGAVASWVITYVDDLDRGLLLSPYCFGFAVVLATLMGEMALRQTSFIDLHSEGLSAARIKLYLPSFTWLPAALFSSGLGTLAVTYFLASPDDRGNDGRALRGTCNGVAMSTTPFPGSFYTIPQVLALVLIAGLGFMTLLLLLGPDPKAKMYVRDSEPLRRQSARMVVAATTLGLAASMSGVFFYAATAYKRICRLNLPAGLWVMSLLCSICVICVIWATLVLMKATTHPVLPPEE